MGQKTNHSVILLVHTINFLKTEVTSASFNTLGKVPSVIRSFIILVIMGRYESQNCLRILAGIALCHVAFFESKLIIFCSTSSSSFFQKCF